MFFFVLNINAALVSLGENTIQLSELFMDEQQVVGSIEKKVWTRIKMKRMGCVGFDKYLESVGACIYCLVALPIFSQTFADRGI